MKSANIRYLIGVDHLRGFAALLVLLYHGVTHFAYASRFHEPFTAKGWLTSTNPFAALVFEGHTAVALFMVLSGFIFTWGTFDRTVRLGQFWKNRFLRTYPLFIALVLVGTAAYSQQVRFPALLQTLLGGSNYLGGALKLGSFSSMFWTIGIEWQFYLLFPFLIAIYRARGHGFALGLITLALVARWIIWVEVGSARDPAYWTLLGRIDQFLLGMLAARFFVAFGDRGWLRWCLLPAAGFVLFGIAVFNQMGGWPSNHAGKVLWPTIEGLGWAAVLVSYLALIGSASGPISRAAAAVGTISYSIYLWHFVVVNALIKGGVTLSLGFGHVGDAFATTLAVAVPATLALATLSYHVIEAPFLALRGSYLGPTAARD
ncbi:MAG: acyltransferase [Myxococcales bacterium]|nr:acyltransferase [Myxococcales bacterium]